MPAPSSELPVPCQGKALHKASGHSDFPVPLKSPACKCTPGDSRAGTPMGALTMVLSPPGGVREDLSHCPCCKEHLFPTRDTSWEGWQGPHHQHSSKRCPDVPSQEIWAGSGIHAEEWGGKAAGLAHPTSQHLPSCCEHLGGRQGCGPAAHLGLKRSGGANKGLQGVERRLNNKIG